MPIFSFRSRNSEAEEGDMRRTRYSADVRPAPGNLVVILAIAALASAACLGTSHASTKAEQASAAARLVEEALHCEIYGLNADREANLQKALEAAPDHAPARWHAGHVRYLNQWVPADTMPDLMSKDRRMSTYALQRERAAHTVEGQLALADWCARIGLKDQERAHLTRVLHFDPDHAVARQRLGFRRVDETWLSADEISESRTRSQEALDNLAAWRPRLEQIRDGLSNTSVFKRNAAAERLAAISDPAAIPALELLLGTHTPDTARLVVDALAGMPGPQASLALSRQAVLSPWSDVRKKAAEQLKARPEDDFVPALLSVMHSPIQARAELFRGPGGRLMYRHAFYREGQEQRELAVFETAYRRIARAGGDRDETLSRALADAAATAQQREFERQRQNELTNLVNQRVMATLEVYNGQRAAASPEGWWEWWNERNEVFMQGDKPLQAAVARQEINVGDRGGQGGGGGGQAGGSVQLPTYGDCLASGTRVWTALGPMPIEEIKVGDLVLSQHPATGELSYQPVLQTTVRPASRLVRLVTAKETIETSGGHAFWVAGDGWTKARLLPSGGELHGMNGSVRISELGEGGFEETYNLIVANSHTYFVGDSRILCHDNTVRRGVATVVPGLADR
jgi:hypothetical protein